MQDDQGAAFGAVGQLGAMRPLERWGAIRGNEAIGAMGALGAMGGNWGKVVQGENSGNSGQLWKWEAIGAMGGDGRK